MRLAYITAIAVLLGMVGCSRYSDHMYRTDVLVANELCANHNGWASAETGGYVAQARGVNVLCNDGVRVVSEYRPDEVHDVESAPLPQSSANLDHQIIQAYCADDTIITARIDVSHDGYPARKP